MAPDPATDVSSRPSLENKVIRVKKKNFCFDKVVRDRTENDRRDDGWNVNPFLGCFSIKILFNEKNEILSFLRGSQPTERSCSTS